MVVQLMESPSEIRQELNERQRLAVEHQDGAALVIAGPGSGKTRVLTLRIAQLLAETPTRHFRVLGLTFTTKAADEMRQRVLDMLPDAHNRLFLGTFHAFCANVLKHYGQYVGVPTDFRIYSRREDLQACLVAGLGRPEFYSPTTYEQDVKLLPVIERLKRFGVTPEEVSERWVEAEIIDRVRNAYRAYETGLEAQSALDFNGLLLKTTQLFRDHPYIADHYRRLFPHIHIDEGQDTNKAQLDMLYALCGETHHNVFVVADEDQILYQWNGASAERLFEFAERFDAVLIEMFDSYRCPEAVVSLANNLIKHNRRRRMGKHPLQAHIPDTNDVVRAFEFSDTICEAEWVARDIQKRGTDRSCWDNFAILARNRWILEPVQDALNGLKIPNALVRRKDEFDHPLWHWFVTWCNLALRPQDVQTLNAVVQDSSYLFGIENEPSWIISGSEVSGKSLFQTLSESLITLLPRTKLSQALVFFTSNQSRARELFEALVNWYERTHREEIDDPLYAGERDFLRRLLLEYRERHPDKVFDLAEFMTKLAMTPIKPIPSGAFVQLMTIHSAKGKEFDEVYIVGMAEGVLPDYRASDGSAQMEEERRSCFVAITRARHRLTLTYPQTGIRGHLQQASRFLVEMGLEGRQMNGTVTW